MRLIRWINNWFLIAVLINVVSVSVVLKLCSDKLEQNNKGWKHLTDRCLTKYSVCQDYMDYATLKVESFEEMETNLLQCEKSVSKIEFALQDYRDRYHECRSNYDN